MPNSAKRFNALTRLVCVLALILVGFAHKPLSAAPLAVQFSAYMLPDGTLPTLCLNEDPTTPVGLAKMDGCDACRLTGAILLPEPPRIGVALAHFAEAPAPKRPFFLAERLYPPSSGPRAPPAMILTVS